MTMYWKTATLSLTMALAGLVLYQLRHEQRDPDTLWRVQLREGIVEETTDLLRSRDRQVDIHSFYGIPYGEAMRFRKPVPTQAWSGVFKADQQVECLQKNLFSWPSVIGQEDCLVVNVHTPRRFAGDAEDDALLLPVMVFLHGGGFTKGSGGKNVLGPAYFMDHDIILVTLNYRLGALGFAGMNDDSMPGNLGLWDQRLALQWIQRNIRAFGGDPTRVTLAGHSAGGVCAHYHELSPRSAGLFHAVITQSGVATLPYGKSDKHPAYYTRTLAQAVGCYPNIEPHKILTCLSLVEPEKLVLESADLFSMIEMLSNPFKPHLDNATSEPFFPRDPLEIIRTGAFNHVPSMQGYNEQDGSSFSAIYTRDSDLFEKTRKLWPEIMAHILFQREPNDITQNERELAGFVLENVLEGQLPSSFAEAGKLLNFFTASYKISGQAGILEMARRGRAGQSPVYAYIYGHKGALSFADLFAFKPWQLIVKLFCKRLLGIDVFTFGKLSGHGDELFLMFGGGLMPFRTIETEEDLKTSQLMVKLWSNFVTFHNPTPNTIKGSDKWTSLDPLLPTMNLAYIQNGELKMTSHDHKKKLEMHEWKQFVQMSNSLHFYDSNTWQDPSLYRKTISWKHEEL